MPTAKVRFVNEPEKRNKMQTKSPWKAISLSTGAVPQKYTYLKHSSITPHSRGVQITSTGIAYMLHSIIFPGFKWHGVILWTMPNGNNSKWQYIIKTTSSLFSTLKYILIYGIKAQQSNDKLDTERNKRKRMVRKCCNRCFSTNSKI